METIDLQNFKFPEVTGTDLIFSVTKTNPKLLEEAKRRNFYGGHTPYNKLFSDLFFNGGKVVFKKDIDPDFKKNAWLYCRSLMSSWEPKHEEKEAVCAMLMSELLEPNLTTK